MSLTLFLSSYMFLLLLLLLGYFLLLLPDDGEDVGEPVADVD